MAFIKKSNRPEGKKSMSHRIKGKGTPSAFKPSIMEDKDKDKDKTKTGQCLALYTTNLNF